MTSLPAWLRSKGLSHLKLPMTKGARMAADSGDVELYVSAIAGLVKPEVLSEVKRILGLSSNKVANFNIGPLPKPDWEVVKNDLDEEMVRLNSFSKEALETAMLQMGKSAAQLQTLSSSFRAFGQHEPFKFEYGSDPGVGFNSLGWRQGQSILHLPKPSYGHLLRGTWPEDFSDEVVIEDEGDQVVKGDEANFKLLTALGWKVAEDIGDEGMTCCYLYHPTIKDRYIGLTSNYPTIESLVPNLPDFNMNQTAIASLWQFLQGFGFVNMALTPSTRSEMMMIGRGRNARLESNIIEVGLLGELGVLDSEGTRVHIKIGPLKEVSYDEMFLTLVIKALSAVKILPHPSTSQKEDYLEWWFRLAGR